MMFIHSEMKTKQNKNEDNKVKQSGPKLMTNANRN